MSRRLPPLNAVRAFEAAARHLSFTRAAEELHVTQAAISHQIKALEERLGLRLFDRRHRALALTPAGQRYLPGVRAAFERLAQATDQLVGAEARGPVTVSMISSFATKWLLPRLSRFRTAHPEIEVRITTSTQLVDFNRDDVDMAIRYGLGRWPGTDAVRLVSEDIFPVCAPALLKGKPPLRKPEDLAHHTLLHIAGFPEDWQVWLTAAGLTGIDPNRGPQFDMTLLALDAAANGLGVALGRTPLVAHDLVSKRLVKPFELEVPLESAYYVVTPAKRTLTPKVVAFRDWLLQEAGASVTMAA
jgi:LysR family transcriptional regulator, glycine cleavage system transcriptional activator